MSIFGRLNIDSSTISFSTELSAGTQKTLKQMPPFLNEWQTQDMSANNAGGYYENKLTANIVSLWSVSNSINIIVGLSETNASSILDASNNLYDAANSFMGHTDRISGVAEPNEETTNLPHYQSAVSAGKIVVYITNQSDGINNNAPIIGNFTSLFTANDLISYYQTIQNYPNTVANSIIFTSGGGIVPDTYTSNLSPTQISTIANNINAVATFMNTKRTHDEEFYTNCQLIVDDYNRVSNFSEMGDSEKYLVNYVGTNKLKSRV